MAISCNNKLTEKELLLQLLRAGTMGCGIFLFFIIYRYLQMAIMFLSFDLYCVINRMHRLIVCTSTMMMRRMWPLRKRPLRSRCIHSLCRCQWRSPRIRAPHRPYTCPRPWTRPHALPAITSPPPVASHTAPDMMHSYKTPAAASVKTKCSPPRRKHAGKLTR